MRRNQSNNGDRAATLALLGILTLFVAIVWYGWQKLFISSAPALSIFIGAVVALIAVALSYGVAAERVYRPEAKAAALAYFFALVNISALGTLNFMFLTFQSGNILREQADRSREAVVALRDQGTASIDTSDFDQFRAAVNEKLRNLSAELSNPALCGQGPVASQRIEELQRLLPAFRPLAGAGNCTKVADLQESYDRQVRQLFAENSVVRASKIDVELKVRIQKEANRLLDELNNVGKLLSGTYSLEEAKARLYDIAERYAVMRQELGNRKGTEAIPLKIDVRSISALGDVGQILPFIMSRLTDIATYVYLLIALVVDLAVIAAFSRVLKVGPSDERRRAAATIRKV